MRGGERLAQGVFGDDGVGGGDAHAASSSFSSVVAVGGMPGQGEEHLVEAGLAEGELGDRGSARSARAASAAAARSASTSAAVRAAGSDSSGDVAAERRGEHTPGFVALADVAHPHVQGAGADRRLEVAARALGDDAAVVDDGEALGELVGLVEVLRRQQHGGALADEHAHDVPDLVAAAWVESGRRLVEEQQVGGHDDAGRDVEAPAHAAGVVAHELVGGVGEAERGEQLVGARRRATRAEAEQAPEQLQVLAAVELLVDRGELAGEAHPPAHRGGFAHDVVAEHPGGSAVGVQQRGEHADRRRLAGAVRAEHAVDGAPPDGEVDAVDGAQLAEHLDEALGLDRQLAHEVTSAVTRVEERPSTSPAGPRRQPPQSVPADGNR